MTDDAAPDGSGVPAAATTARTRKESRHLLDCVAIGIAALAAIFGGWQARILSDTAERQLRAYVYISQNSDFHKNLDGSSTFTVKPSANVFGATPAAWLSPSWNLQKLPAWSPEKEFPSLQLTSATRYDVVKVTGQVYGMEEKNLTLNDSDIEALQNHHTMIVSFGRITYTDVFGKRRWTNFCTLFDWHDLNTASGQTCPQFNDSDWSGSPPPLSLPLQIRIIAPSPPAQKPP
jgi:hypothetical protein